MKGRPKAELILKDTEREQLMSWARRRKTSQALALRSRIVLECAKGAENKTVAQRLAITPQTVSKWRTQFVSMWLDGLVDAPRSGAPRTIEDTEVDALIARTLESTPKDATHWSTRGMAKEMGMSQSAVSRIWQAFGLQPHRQETFKLSTDPLFVEKTRDIVGLYMPHRCRPWCCVSMRRVKFRHWTEPSLFCHWRSASPSDARMITCGMVQSPCLRHSILPLARSLVACIAVTAAASF